MKPVLNFVLLFSLAYLVCDVISQADTEWKQFKTKYKKTYKDTTTEKLKRSNWEKSRALIKKHNAETASGLHSYSLSENEFSDWTPEERKKLGGSKLSATILNEAKTVRHKGAPYKLKPNPPSTLDLRESPCMPGIKNQGACGSCWAFAGLTPLEFQLCTKLDAASKLSLSEQQIVDCSVEYGTNGCQGGWVLKAWDYVNATGTLNLDTSYRYTATAGRCQVSRNGIPVKISSSGYVPIIKNEDDIKAALYTYGPIAAVLHSALETFQLLGAGIYSDGSCPSDGSTVDHAVVIVGYGSEKGMNYWIIRNSWGTTWGVNGYGRIRRGVNQCNIAAWPAYVQI